VGFLPGFVSDAVAARDDSQFDGPQLVGTRTVASPVRLKIGRYQALM
jgi:hypothetical protein